MIKTFRGLLADGGQDRIRLSTIKGKVGYRIVKLQVIPYDSPGAGGEFTVKIFKSEQASGTLTDKIEFTDSDLLAAGFFSSGNASQNYPQDVHIIFDNEIFNQDIYISALDSDGGSSLNYYLELEVVPLDDKGAEYTTVKDLRSRGF